MKNLFSRFATSNPLTVFTIDVSPDGRTLAIGQEGDAESQTALGLWSTNECRRLATLVRGDGAISLSARFSPSGDLLAYSDADQRMVIRDRRTGEESRETFPLACTKWMSFAKRRDRLIAGGVRTQVWDVDKRTVLWTLPVEAEAETGAIDPPCCALSPDGGRVAASGVEKGRILVYDLSSGEIVGRVKHSMNDARAMAFDPTGRLLAVISMGGGAGVWNLDTGQAILPEIISNTTDYYWCVRFSPDGERVGLGLWSGFVEVVQLKDGSYIVNQEAPVHRGRVRDIAFMPDGSQMFTGGDDGVVLVWDI